MQIQNSLQQFALSLASLRTENPYNVYHYWRPMMSAPFVVWAETGEAEDFHTDNAKAEVLLNVTVDVYTQTEFDSLLDEVYSFLNDEGIPFSLTEVSYEEATQLIHYSYSCELVVK